MFKQTLCILFLAAQLISAGETTAKSSPDFQITTASATLNKQLNQLVFEIRVNGTAGKTTPTPRGQLDKAPVLGYVFPTTLKSTDVGFGKVEGIVALALTSHPDFDDTPLWDENNNSNYGDDGVVWHPHWVVLIKDERVTGGLSVKQFEKGDSTVILPPTNPGMPMYMDSPGYPVITHGASIKVIVPGYRINNAFDFQFDGVAAYMQVNTSLQDKPMLGVYEVFSVASGNLSLPYSVKE